MNSNGRGVRVVLLCEDRRQFNFARRWLLEFGFGKREITEKISPRGRGAGEQFVRSQFPIEVATIRSKAFQRLAVVVVIDADVSSVSQRESQLTTSLPIAVEPSERISLLVPKRNIETWIVELQGSTADETTDYKKRVVDSEPGVAGKKFAELVRDSPANTPSSANASLLHGIEVACRFLKNCPGE